MRARRAPHPLPPLAQSLHFLPALPTRRSISVPGPRALAMADTYAVVQKRAAPAGTGAGARGRGAEEEPLYSQVTPRARRPQAHAEDARGLLPGRGESGQPGARGGRAGSHLRLLPTQSCWLPRGPPTPQFGPVRA